MRPLEETIGYRFKNGDILKEALTHKSYSSEHRAERYNERLEFLGDSVLGLAAAHFAYLSNPDCDEGTLSKLKSRLVAKPYLCAWARDIGLGGHLYLGQGELSSGGNNRESILANAMEALLGAVYLDGGFAPAQKLTAGRMASHPLESEETDYKSQLQELLQKKHKVPPDYIVTQTVGPEHDKTFTITVNIGGAALGKGKGRNKKEAEQRAAKDALDRVLKNPRGIL